MIIVRLSGGLGNQMFQYAVGRTLSLKHGVSLGLDIRFLGKPPAFNNDTVRQYELGVFSISGNVVDRSQIPLIYKISNPFFARLYDLTIGRLIKKNGVEKKHSFDPCVLELGPNTYLSGFWQDEKYFNGIEETIRNDFSLVNDLSAEAKKVLMEITKCEAVSIHVRRGDYVSNKIANSVLGLCPLSYYQDAIKLISEKVNNPHFFVFSDDIEWCKNNIKTNSPISFIGGKNYEDLILMSKCQHNIIANSSFSWWGGWLNSNKNKIVIAPKKWYSDETFRSNNLALDTWLKI